MSIAKTPNIDCCGCNACGDVCPTRAIRFEADLEGFLHPVVDNDRCIHCGRCEKVCPSLHASDKLAAVSASRPTAWAAVSKSLPVRFDSTSGGVFSTLADEILARGGFVGGAVWDEGFTIRQIVTDSKEDIPRLRSSKYAQSDACGFYNAVSSAVKTGKPVFVCGTPCQMMALKLFVGDPENLITADFVCRGANSPLVMRKYVEEAQANKGSHVIAIKQKSKDLGWRNLTTKFSFENGEVLYDPRSTSPFMQSYLIHNLISRESCYECKCKGVSRVVDFTLADCWGIVEKLDPDKFDHNLGTSLVLCHTEKARRLFGSIRPKLESQCVDIESVLTSRSPLLTSLDRPVADRERFFSLLATHSFSSALTAVVEPPTTTRKRRSLARRLASRLRYLFSLAWDNRRSLLTLIRINGLRKVLHGYPLLRPNGRVLVQREPSATITAQKTSVIGASVFKGTTVESRLRMEAGSSLTIAGGNISYGCDIEVFSGGKVEIGDQFFSNFGLTLICAKSVKIGQGVTIGRNVSIRDFHGDHWLNTEGYQTIRPVTVQDHVWLCSECSIMPGVTIGTGSVVAAHAVVTKNVPPNTLVAGCPARVIRDNVQWRR